MLFGHTRDAMKTSIGRAPGEIGAEMRQMGAHGATNSLPRCSTAERS